MEDEGGGSTTTAGQHSFPPPPSPLHSYTHPWQTCAYAHEGERARRRDPRGPVHYTGIACPDMKAAGACVRGDLCPYAHNVFEYWLHPTR